MRRLLNAAREEVAAFLAVRPQEIIFTSSGTESMNMLLRGTAELLSPGHLITSSVEHACTLSAIQAMEENGWSSTFLSPGSWGAVTPDAVLAAFKPDTKLLILMAANNETGVKTDLHGMADVAISKRVPFIVDGVALLGKETFQIPEGVSAIAFSGHKIHALQGSAFAFVRSSLKLQPQLTGGSQEFGRRAGTENLLGILSLGRALTLLKEELPKSVEKMVALRNQFEQTLFSELPGAMVKVMVNGDGPRVSNVSNLAFNGVDGESLLIALDRAGIAASHGSACASGALEPSHVLQNMGYDLERVRSSLRFSFSRLNTFDEVEAACKIIIDLIKR